ncbi:MAG TPA: glycosyltransferase family 4 protein, partial [Thermoanaerobaculia bacterium]|nr:glycosyltransferase family 4 protein [Thermoanaerobaculia bacterium]
MKILSILTYYAPHWTGLTAHAVRLAEGLAARGHEVTVLTTRHAPELPRREVLHGVRVVRLATAGRFSRGMIAPAFPIAAWRLVAAHDVVQIHTPLPEALLAAAAARALDRPCVMTHHGDLVLPPGPLNRAVQAAGHLILAGAGALSDAVTVYNRDYAESSRLLLSLGHKVHAIRPPVSLPRPDISATAAWRAELGLGDRAVVGFAGRWVEEKGFDVLLRALPLLQERHPRAHLVYAGEPNVAYERTFERCRPLLDAVRGHVTTLGLLRDPERMARFYAMCDVFALPSRSDMLALVQVEALLSGTPVVASDIPGARVAVRETGYGRLAPADDPRGLADALGAVLTNRERHAPRRERIEALF